MPGASTGDAPGCTKLLPRRTPPETENEMTKENNCAFEEIKEQQDELTAMRNQYISELSLNPSPAKALRLNELISEIDIALDVAIKVMAEIGKE